MPAVVGACATLTASISLRVPSAEGSGKGCEANQGVEIDSSFPTEYRNCAGKILLP